MELVLEVAREDARVRYVRETDRGYPPHAIVGFAKPTANSSPTPTTTFASTHCGWRHRAGFPPPPRIGCVTGLVASASWSGPPSSTWTLELGGHRVAQRLFDPSAHPGDSRLHPYAPGMFGTGANVAFPSEAIETIGGFDESLGAGSPTSGGEDLDAFVRLLRSGRTLSYEPAALVWHDHRVDETELQEQMYSYGKGLSAYLCKFLCAPSAGREVAARISPARCMPAGWHRSPKQPPTMPAWHQGSWVPSSGDCSPGPGGA